MLDSRWHAIGDVVLKPLSLGRLHSFGRQMAHNGKRLQAAPIPPEFWREAKLTFWFLDAGPSVADASNGNDWYSEIEVDRAEAVAIWPNGVEISLLDAARQIYEAVKDRPIGILIGGVNEDADDMLTWICNEVAMYRNGKEPLVKLCGNKPPSRVREEIYTAPLTNYDFVVEGMAILLKERYGKLYWENLTVIAADIDRAIQVLAARDV